MGMYVWVDTPAPNGSVPTTFTAWGGFVVPTVGPPGPPAPSPPVPIPVPVPFTARVVCELFDLNQPVHQQLIETVDPCGVFCNGKQWRATFGQAPNPSIPAGTNYRVKATLWIGGTARDNETSDPITVNSEVLAVEPLCEVVLPGGGGLFPDPEPFPNPSPLAGDGLAAAVGGGMAAPSTVMAVGAGAALAQPGRGYPISFDYPWDPRIALCLGLVFVRGTSIPVSVSRGAITIGRCGVVVPIPPPSSYRYTAKVLLLDRAGQVIRATSEIGLPR